MNMTVIPIVVVRLECLRKVLKKNRDHPNHSLVKIDLNTEKSPEDSKRLVTLTPVRRLSIYAGAKNS